VIAPFIVGSDSVNLSRSGNAHSVSLRTADALTVTVWNVSAGVSLLLTSFSTEASDSLKAYTAVFSPDLDADSVVFSFSGGYGRVYDFAAFSRSYDSDSDVPVFSKKYAYTLPSDFRSISRVTLSPEFGMRCRDSRDFSIRDGQILLPWDFCGIAEITYAANPAPISDSTAGTTALSVSDEASQALCFYVAAELTEEDDSELASRFRSRYRSALSNLSPTHTPNRILPSIYLDPREKLIK